LFEIAVIQVITVIPVIPLIQVIQVIPVIPVIPVTPAMVFSKFGLNCVCLKESDITRRTYMLGMGSVMAIVCTYNRWSQGRNLLSFAYISKLHGHFR